MKNRFFLIGFAIGFALISRKVKRVEATLVVNKTRAVGKTFDIAGCIDRLTLIREAGL